MDNWVRREQRKMSQPLPIRFQEHLQVSYIKSVNSIIILARLQPIFSKSCKCENSIESKISSSTIKLHFIFIDSIWKPQFDCHLLLWLLLLLLQFSRFHHHRTHHCATTTTTTAATQVMVFDWLYTYRQTHTHTLCSCACHKLLNYFLK